MHLPLNIIQFRASLVTQMVKNPPVMRETQGLIPGLGRSSGGGYGNPLQHSYLENPHGQRSLSGYSPWGRKDLDMTERLSTAQHSIVQFIKCTEIIFLLQSLTKKIFLNVYYVQVMYLVGNTRIN